MQAVVWGPASHHLMGQAWTGCGLREGVQAEDSDISGKTISERRRGSRPVQCCSAAEARTPSAEAAGPPRCREPGLNSCF